MSDNRKALRIIAGILIIFAVISYLCFSFAEAVRAGEGHVRSTLSYFISSTLVWMFCGAALTLGAIFVFAKKPVGSGVAMCVAVTYWLYMIVRQLLFEYSVFTFMNLAFYTLCAVASALAAVGFFLRGKRSVAPFVIAGVLTLLAAAGGMIFLYFFAADLVGIPEDAFRELASASIFSYLPNHLPIVAACFLLASYFGAQKDRVRAPAAPQYPPAAAYTPPQGYAPPQQYVQQPQGYVTPQYVQPQQSPAEPGRGGPEGRR